MQGKETQLQNFKEKALLTAGVFMRNETFLGLPSNVFILGAVFSAAIFFMLFWVSGLAFAAFFYWGMYRIHEKDPRAFVIWTKALGRSLSNKSTRWSSGYCQSTRLVIIR